MAHNGEYFRRRAAEARAAAFRREQGEDAEIAGQLALAYAALARRTVDGSKVSGTRVEEDVEA